MAPRARLEIVFLVVLFIAASCAFVPESRIDFCNTSHYAAMQQGEGYMERQLTMRLPADLADKLERSAKRLKRKRSEVVREALEQYLDTQPEVRPIERVRDLLGSVESGIPDLGQRHREYLIRRLRRGR
jgi:hypothetical protein